jgi:hypothetical protein
VGPVNPYQNSRGQQRNGAAQPPLNNPGLHTVSANAAPSVGPTRYGTTGIATARLNPDATSLASPYKHHNENQHNKRNEVNSKLAHASIPRTVVAKGGRDAQKKWNCAGRERQTIHGSTKGIFHCSAILQTYCEQAIPGEFIAYSSQISRFPFTTHEQSEC